MGGRDTVPLEDCGGGETGEIGFAQYKDSDTLWVWPKNTHLDKIKITDQPSLFWTVAVLKGNPTRLLK